MVRLSLTVATTSFDAPNASVWFKLPTGMVPVAGQIRQSVNLVKGIPQTFELEVRLLAVGEHRVTAGADIQFAHGGSFGGGDDLFLNVTPSGSTVRREPTPRPVFASGAIPGDDNSGLSIVLTALETAPIGGMMRIRVSILSEWSEPQTVELSVVAPDGVALLGQARQTLRLLPSPPNLAQQIIVPVRPERPGRFQVTVTATLERPPMPLAPSLSRTLILDVTPAGTTARPAPLPTPPVGR